MRWLVRWFSRAPDFVIGGPNRPYIRRWWVIPRNRWCNIYLHQILRDDDDRALHDHPWVNCSIILSGVYVEIALATTPDEFGTVAARRRPWRPVFRRATQAHRIVLDRDAQGKTKPAWSLFLTGPVIREWGFHCPQGWRPWREFVDTRDKGAVGRGCAD